MKWGAITRLLLVFNNGTRFEETRSVNQKIGPIFCQPDFLLTCKTKFNFSMIDTLPLKLHIIYIFELEIMQWRSQSYRRFVYRPTKLQWNASIQILRGASKAPCVLSIHTHTSERRNTKPIYFICKVKWPVIQELMFRILQSKLRVQQISTNRSQNFEPPFFCHFGWKQKIMSWGCFQ